MNAETFVEGLTVKSLIKVLKKLPQDKPFMVACDEEQNTIFQGFYVAEGTDFILIAGLSGTEVE